MTEFISSAQNPKIKKIFKLRKAGQRKKTDEIIVEGAHEIELAIASGAHISELYICPQYAKKKLDLEGTEVSTKIFDELSYRESPDGFMALVKVKKLKLADLIMKKNPIILILDSIEKPGNLGAILRTADGAGVDAVIVNNERTDIYNPNAIRASLGTVFTNQVAVASIMETKEWLEKNKIRIFAAFPDAEKTYTEAKYNGGIAIIVGEEHAGISRAWLEACPEKISIPMAGEIDSLNVSVSAAIILFEAIRQRKN